MWTPTTGKQHNRATDRYPSDLTDGEWRVIEPYLPTACGTGRPWAWPLREIVNGRSHPVWSFGGLLQDLKPPQKRSAS
jgi:putative transposase